MKKLIRHKYPDGFILESTDQAAKNTITGANIKNVLSGMDIHYLTKQYPSLNTYDKIANYMMENTNLQVSFFIPKHDLK